MDVNYVIIYLFANALGAYTVVRLVEIFLGKESKIKQGTCILGIFYWLLTLVMHIVVNIPIITFVSNILGISLLTANYKSRIYKKIVTVAFVYLTILLIETIIVLLTGYHKLYLFTEGTFSSELGLVSSKLITFMIVSFLEKYQGVSKGQQLSRLYCFCVFFVPCSSILVLLCILNWGELPNSILTMCFVTFLIINFSVFYLYDALQLQAEKEAQRKIILQEQAYTIKEYEMMKLSMESIQDLRHDLRNHLMSIQILIKNGENEEIKKYINEIINAQEIKKKYVATGNVILDSILNFKIFEAEKFNIKIFVDVHIPFDIKLNAFDITTILGNLIDNAVQASKSKKIDLKLGYDKGRLLLRISNDFYGKIIFNEEGKPETTKTNKNVHGIGLKNVERIVNKYDGTFDIDIKNGMFIVFIMLYLN